MSALDHLLAARDPFALFGLDRSFDVDLTQLNQRYAGLREQVQALAASDPDKAGRVLVELDHGRKAIASPVARGRLLLALLGGAGEPPTDGMPPGFREKLDGTDGGVTRDWHEAERRRLIENASNLFRLLGSADNGVVKRERRRQIRVTLNAIEEVDRRTAPS